MTYKIITAWELCKLIYDEKVETIGFIEGDPDDFIDGKEPDFAWYGIGYTRMFDDYKVVFGYWGAGIIRVSAMIEGIQDVFDALQEFWALEFHEVITPERKVFVDADDMKDIGM